jgi:cellulose biosynthesis protein BcsQ
MVNLAATLVLQGERVLCIDFAQQANLIMSLDC